MSAKLSALDIESVLPVPPGGNWKDIPETIPLKRLETIRTSYAEGKGSRSTYYGRLHPDRPAYTINTYFSRPGNGCHIHYDYEGGQHRVLSQREAARLQSFPDNFVFKGSQSAINIQIGNAVPPLLAYQIARTLGEPGCFVDLFAGAGGLCLGFQWAGWQPLLSSDLEKVFLETHRHNINHNLKVIAGDIREKAAFEQILEASYTARSSCHNQPVWVIGGPPCQGFSTAGKRRSNKDERNHLVWHYRDFLEAFSPDGFLFENVTGLLNMDGGRTYREVKDVLGELADTLTPWVLSAEEYAIPQRRKRLILIGSKHKSPPQPPKAITSADKSANLFGGLQPAISVREALDDLPALESGQDGSHLTYRTSPHTTYQALMRSCMSPGDYLNLIERGVRTWSPTQNRPS